MSSDYLDSKRNVEVFPITIIRTGMSTTSRAFPSYCLEMIFHSYILCVLWNITLTSRDFFFFGREKLRFILQIKVALINLNQLINVFQWSLYMDVVLKKSVNGFNQFCYRSLEYYMN